MNSQNKSFDMDLNPVIGDVKDYSELSSENKNSNLAFILSSPSGGGKSSIARKIIEIDKKCLLSISTTTRQMRGGEVDGVDYNFVSNNAFSKMIAEQELIEYTSIYGNFYGTTKKTVLGAFKDDKDIVFDIDWNGNKAFKNFFKNRAISIYILPPSIEELKKRLILRNDSMESVNNRISYAKKEIMYFEEYDYVVINKNFDDAISQVMSIIKSSRLKKDFVDGKVIKKIIDA